MTLEDGDHQRNIGAGADSIAIGVTNHIRTDTDRVPGGCRPGAPIAGRIENSCHLDAVQFCLTKGLILLPQTVIRGIHHPHGILDPDSLHRYAVVNAAGGKECYFLIGIDTASISPVWASIV